MGLISAFKDYRESLYRYGGDDYTLLSPADIKAAQGLPFPGSGGGAGWGNSWGFSSTWPGTKIDFTNEVGELRNSSLIQAAHRWIGRGLNSARAQVVKLDSDSKETDQRDHPVAQLLRRPNPYYSGSALMSGISLSWLVFATAYVLKIRSRANRVVELWYEPHMTIRPRWPENGSEFISFYEILRGGKWIRIEKEDVLVFRDGIDPETRCGMSPMSSLMREFYTDQQASAFMAKLLRSGLVPPIVVALGSKDYPFQDDAQGTRIRDFQTALVRKMSGDNAGEPMVTAGYAEVSKLGFEYDKIGMREVRQVPEERFCAATGISPHSLYFGTAASTSTYSNVEQYQRHDYRSYIVPLQDALADEMDLNLLPEFGESENLRTAWNYDKTPEMEPDVMAATKRSAILYTTQGIDRAEYREANGYAMRPEDEGVYYVGKARVDNPTLDNSMSDGTKFWADSFTDDDLDAGLDWWRRSAPKEARGLARAQPVKANGHAS